MNNFRPIDRQTPYLLPPSVEDWLPERHLARFGCEAPIGLGLMFVAAVLPCGHLFDQCFLIRNAPVEALRGQNAPTRIPPY